MKFQQIIFALNRIIQVLISLEYTLFNIIPKSLVTLQFLKFLIVQIKAYIQGFQMRYQSFLGHWYPNSYSWFSDSMDILFVLITTVHKDFHKHVCSYIRSFVCQSVLPKTSNLLDKSVHSWKSNLYCVLFCKFRLSKMTSIRTNKLQKSDTTSEDQLFMTRNFVLGPEKILPST